MSLRGSLALLLIFMASFSLGYLGGSVHAFGPGLPSGQKHTLTILMLATFVVLLLNVLFYQ